MCGFGCCGKALLPETPFALALALAIELAPVLCALAASADDSESAGTTSRRDRCRPTVLLTAASGAGRALAAV